MKGLDAEGGTPRLDLSGRVGSNVTYISGFSPFKDGERCTV
jgi:hypothetical protein